MRESKVFQLEAIATVIGGHLKVADDYQGSVESVIRFREEIPEETLQGLEEFSHVQVVWKMDQARPEDVELHARSPRGNPQWPATGTFVHRNHRRPAQVGISHPRLKRVEGRDVVVTGLDAVDGTPVLDLSPWFPQMGPQGEVRVPAWVDEMLADYWAPADTRPVPQQ
ncbi:TrmO family methyltransferase [Streptomyces erythrochromogenes]|uniref:TrmO family methyltransferase domain-containing protein n=1 Tax=Streptomyces erythrochromogenes TaxID=285574 RepID=UPI00342B4AB9